MTSFAPDLPDWTTESSAGVLYGQDQGIPAGGSIGFGLAGIGSYIIRLQSNTSNCDVLVGLTYFITGLGAINLQEVILTAQQSKFGPVGFQYESPSYGSGIEIVNGDPNNPLFCSVVSSNRNVDQPRYLNDLTTGSIFINQLGSGFVAATPNQLLPIASTCNGVPVNVQTAFVVDSNGAGLLEFWYKAEDYSQRKLTIGNIVAGTQFSTIMSLPACIGQLVFTPTATNVAGAISVQSYAAYTG